MWYHPNRQVVSIQIVLVILHNSWKAFSIQQPLHREQQTKTFSLQGWKTFPCLGNERNCTFQLLFSTFELCISNLHSSFLPFVIDLLTVIIEHYLVLYKLLVFTLLTHTELGNKCTSAELLKPFAYQDSLDSREIWQYWDITVNLWCQRKIWLRQKS